MQIEDVLDSNELMEVARAAVEEHLIERRDARIALLHKGNGLCVREKDGSASSDIRMGFEEGLEIGLKAILQKVDLVRLWATQEKVGYLKEAGADALDYMVTDAKADLETNFSEDLLRKIIEGVL